MRNHRGFVHGGMVWGVFGMVLGLLCGAARGEGDPAKKGFGFGPMEILKMEYELVAAQAADVNGDGRIDLVIVNNHKSRIDVLLQKKDFNPQNIKPPEAEGEDVNDLFGRESQWRFKRVSIPLEVKATSLVVADLNNDERPDLAWYSPQGIYVLLQEKAQGGEEKKAEDAAGAVPAWQTATKIDLREGANHPNALLAADMNYDDLCDLILQGENAYFVVRQKPDGTMAPAMRYPGVTEKIKRMWVSDLNQDQIPDLVTLTEDPEYPVWVCLGDSQGKPGPGMRAAMPGPRDMDLEYVMPNSRSPEVISISNEGGRVLVYSWQFAGKAEQETLLHYAFAGGESADKRDIAAGDLDGDGLTDAVVSDPDRAEFILYRGRADGSFTEPATYPGLKDMQKLTTASDGGAGESLVCLSIKEKIIGVSRFENGRITYPAVADVTGEPLAMDTTDINGDGTADLVYIAREKDKQKSQFFMRSVLNLGRENTAAGPELEVKDLKDPPVDVRIADLDQDGMADVMIYRSFGPAILLRQTGAGIWVQVSDTEKNSGLVSSLTPAGTTVAALEEGGKPVLLAAQKEFARSLKFEPERGWQIVDQYAAADAQSRLTAVQAIARAGQKARQIAAYDSARQKMVFLSRQEDGTFRTEQEIAVGNLDIKKILPLTSPGGGATRMLLAGPRKMVLLQMPGQSVSLDQAADFEPDIKNGKYGQIGVGDLNGDSQPELMVCEQSKNHIEILTVSGDSGLECGYKFKVFESPRGLEEHFGREGGREPRYAMAADVTGDGKNDLIVLVHDRIILYPQE